MEYNASNKPNVKIIVAAHKNYQMPSDNMYLPLHVGAEGKFDYDGSPLDFGFIKDNTGDNISELNPCFCELTGLYWAWKNLHADFIGLVHYRRYFSLSKKNATLDGVLTYDQLKPYLNQAKIIVPQKRRYYIETLYSHYAHTHYAQHLDETRRILQEMHPVYFDFYDRVLTQRSGYMFNMMIMRQDWLDHYCNWIFPIISELKKRVNADNLSDFQSRFGGRVSEIIFNVWLAYQLECKNLQKSDVVELPWIGLEKTNLWKKGTAFIKAKLFCKRYESSN